MLHLGTLKNNSAKLFRHFFRVLNDASVFFVVLFIDIYRLTFSSMMPGCRFTPTCSAYSKEAFLKYSFFKGLLMTVHRLGRCHPWGGSGHDPVLKHPHSPITGRNN